MVGAVGLNFGVFALDPGTTSGLMSGRFRELGTVSETLKNASALEEIESWEVTGPPDAQCVEIVEELMSWSDGLLDAGVPLDRQYVVVESFALRGHKALAGNEALDPVRVGWGVKAILLNAGWDGRFSWQMPSSAKGFATTLRLRRWDLWVVGSDHCRDAGRHLALATSRVLAGKW